MSAATVEPWNVDDDDQGEEAQASAPELLGDPVDPTEGDRTFEGRVIEGSEVKITGVTTLDGLNDWKLAVDDRVRFVTEARVTAVSHTLDKDGNLRRQHTIKAIRVEPTPWNPGDPNDQGVLRAL